MLIVRKAEFDCDVVAHREAGLVQALAKCRKAIVDEIGRRGAAEKPDHRHCRLLRPRCDRPCRRRAADKRDEIAPSHERSPLDEDHPTTSRHEELCVVSEQKWAAYVSSGSFSDVSARSV